MVLRVRNILKRALFGRARPRVIRLGLFAGLRFTVDPEVQTQAILGLWEREVARYVESFAAQSVSAVDVGAAAGWYTIYLLSRDWIRRVHACEPNGNALERLHENLQLNGLFHDRRLMVWRNWIGDRDDGNCVRLDSVLAHEEGPLFVKIDVDGGELEVLRGARATLLNKKCALVVETHSTSLEEECRAVLSNLGYKCQIVRNAWYRFVVPEHRPSELNRWLIGWRDDRL